MKSVVSELLRMLEILWLFFLKYYTFKETPKLKRLDNFWYICSKGMRILLVSFQDR